MKNKKRNAIIRLVIWSVVLVLLTGTLVVGLVGVPFKIDKLNLSISNQYFFDEKNYNRGGGDIDAAIHCLEVEWISGRVTVQPHEGATVRLEETDGLPGDEQLRWKVEDGILRIFPRKAFRFLGPISLPEKNLNIYLPQGMVPEELEITTVSGNITLQQFSCIDAGIETVSGNIDILGCDITDLECESVSGDAGFNGTLQRLDWGSVSGNAEITTATMPARIRSDAVSGDITVTITDGPGFTVETEKVSGDFNCDFPLLNARRYGDGSADYRFESVSGNIYLKKH